MKRSCPFGALPLPVHPSLRVASAHVNSKRRHDFDDRTAKRFCSHVCLKRKSEAEQESAKRMRLEELESRTNMLVDAYRRIDHLERIIRQLGIELQFYRQKTSNPNYNSQIIAY